MICVFEDCRNMYTIMYTFKCEYIHAKLIHLTFMVLSDMLFYSLVITL